MAAINITEKGVDILVNGTQEASYSQRANVADYDVSLNNPTISVTNSGSITYPDGETTAVTTDVTDFTQNTDAVVNQAVAATRRLYVNPTVISTGTEFEVVITLDGTTEFSERFTGLDEAEVTTTTTTPPTMSSGGTDMLGNWEIVTDLISGTSSSQFEFDWVIEYIVKFSNSSVGSITQS